ncbi:MAG: hypothetical protein Q8L41_05075 [Anaerolineales bacterium]|nr:hypothetical protein [Anaerolineales bacterium]
MKKMLVLMVVLVATLSGCLPAMLQPEAANPTLITEADLQTTAEILSQQTLQSLPTATVAPSETAVVMTATETPIQSTPTATQNPILLTLTATLGTGTVSANNETPVSGTLPFTGTPSATAKPAFSATPTLEARPLSYGTLPPNLPSGTITLINNAKVDVYISLRSVTKEGYITILEYPIKSSVEAKAPAGKYTYVAWVGGKQFTGAFSLSKGQDLVINIFKDRIGIK